MWGTLNLYVTSFMRIKGDTELTTKTVGMVFPFMMFSMACTLPFGVKVMQTIGSPRKAAIILTILCAASIFFSSFCEVFAAFCIIYGICFGFFSGLLYMMPIYCGYLYFPTKKGLVSGLVLTGIFLKILQISIENIIKMMIYCKNIKKKKIFIFL